MLSLAATATSSVAVRLAEESEDFNPLLPKTGELVIGTIAFVLLYVVLSKFVFPLFEKAYAERTAAIEGGIAKAEQAQAEAAAALEQYTAQLAEARSEAARIRDEAREQGKQIVDQLTSEAREAADRITASSEARLEADRQQVVVQLRSEIGRLAVELSEKVVGESLADEERARRVVDRFLAELEQQQGSTS